MIAAEFKVGSTYISTITRDMHFTGKSYKEGDTLTFKVVETPCNKFNGNWLKVSVEGYAYAWDRIYLHDLENVSELPTEVFN